MRTYTRIGVFLAVAFVSRLATGEPPTAHERITSGHISTPDSLASPPISHMTAEDFARLNPGYLERAGKFYEEKYLPGAVDGLARYAGLSDSERPMVRKLLRDYIDRFLGCYVAGGGLAEPAQVREVLARLDAEFQQRLTEPKYAKYLEWRVNRSGENPLAFIMPTGNAVVHGGGPIAGGTGAIPQRVRLRLLEDSPLGTHRMELSLPQARTAKITLVRFRAGSMDTLWGRELASESLGLQVSIELLLVDPAPAAVPTSAIDALDLSLLLGLSARGPSGELVKTTDALNAGSVKDSRLHMKLDFPARQAAFLPSTTDAVPEKQSSILAVVGRFPKPETAARQLTVDVLKKASEQGAEIYAVICYWEATGQ